MLIRMLATAAGPNGTFLSGSIREVSNTEGQNLISGGYAVEEMTLGMKTPILFGNRWWTTQELGEGGQGKVYLVEDQRYYGPLGDKLRDSLKSIGNVTTYEKTRELVQLIGRINWQDNEHKGALKRLHANKDSKEYKQAIERMKKELDALRGRNHPHMVKVYDESIEDGWFVMEYFPQGPLSQHKELFVGDIEKSLNAFRKLVQTVAILHENKFVHRDIKPDNIYLKDNNDLVLGDFGLIWLHEDGGSRVTDTYENVGSRDWMPPWAQSVIWENVLPNFDVFCLGKLLWAMISGKTKLLLWYFRKEGQDLYNLEKIFPQDPGMAIVNDLLARCIVEEAKDCLPSAKELLIEVDRVISKISGQSVHLANNTKRKCLVCGDGIYSRIVNGNQSATQNFGLAPRGGAGFKIYQCNHCGHIQLFYFDDINNVTPLGPGPMAWQSDPPRTA